MVKEINRNVKSIRKRLCGGCKGIYLRFVLDEWENIEDKELCYVWDNRKEFYNYIWNSIEDSNICYYVMDIVKGKRLKSVIEDFKLWLKYNR